MAPLYSQLMPTPLLSQPARSGPSVVKLSLLAALLAHPLACASAGSTDEQSSGPSNTDTTATSTATLGSEAANSTSMASGNDTSQNVVTQTSSAAPTSATQSNTNVTQTSAQPSSTSTLSSSGPNTQNESSEGSSAATSGVSSGAQTTNDGSSSSPEEASTSDSQSVDLKTYAQGFDELTIHDACTAPNPGSPDTCLHEQQHEETFVFGGEPGEVYDVELRVRGLFEPTNINGGTTPYAEFPYFKVGGTVNAADYSQWHIVVSEPQATYWLNHYPSTGHTIYKEDFTCVIPVAAGADVSVRVVDGNDRMIDNGATGLADRQQTLDGVTDGVWDGQVLRLDVEGVELRQ